MSGGELKIVSFQNCHEIASWTKMEFLTLCQSFGEQATKAKFVDMDFLFSTDFMS